jgi:hypothetical protein
MKNKIETENLPLSKKFEDFIFEIDSYQSPYAEAVGDPGEIIRPLVRKYSLQAAALSSALSVLPGNLGVMSILPEIYFLIRLQSRMVKDIAILLGKESYLSKELLLYCLFKENKINIFNTSIRTTGTRLLIRPISLDNIQTIFYSVIYSKSSKIVPRKNKGLLSLISMLTGGSLSYIDTQMVGTTANAIFLGDIEFQNSEQPLNDDLLST